MAAGTIPAPGSKYGPCLNACIHRDCAQSRTIAAHSCPICSKAIGYAAPYYIRDGLPYHAGCLEREAEKALDGPPEIY